MERQRARQVANDLGKTELGDATSAKYDADGDPDATVPAAINIVSAILIDGARRSILFVRVDQVGAVVG